LGLLLCHEKVKDLINYLDVLVNSRALVCHPVAVETAVAQQAFLARFSRSSGVVLARSRNIIPSASVYPLSNFFGAGQGVLDHGNFLPEGVHFNHLFEVVPEGVVVFLDELAVLGHAVEVELVVLLVPEELLLH
jgi:hypothetical protein